MQMISQSMYKVFIKVDGLLHAIWQAGSGGVEDEEEKEGKGLKKMRAG